MHFNTVFRLITLFSIAIIYPSYVHLLIYFHWNDPKLIDQYPVIFDALRLSFSSKLLPMIYIWRKACLISFFIPGFSSATRSILICPLIFFQLALLVLLVNFQPYKEAITNLHEIITNICF